MPDGHIQRNRQEPRVVYKIHGGPLPAITFVDSSSSNDTENQYIFCCGGGMATLTFNMHQFQRHDNENMGEAEE